jgi:hypothetical protein
MGVASEFLVYLRLGFEHIADPRGYDHILFIVALTAMYRFGEWRQVLILVTAFTVGHSITLALATTGVLSINAYLVEVLIPATIVATSLLNVAEAAASPAEFQEPRAGRIGKYVLASGFGLIHGMGFSNFLRSALGSEESIALPLFAFNVGLEVGQVFIVLSVMVVSMAAVRLLGVPRRRWILILSAVTAGIALFLLVERIRSG